MTIQINASTDVGTASLVGSWVPTIFEVRP